jgi:hypothetical protein
MAGLRKLSIFGHLIVLLRYIIRVHRKLIKDVRRKRVEDFATGLVVGEIRNLLLRRYGGQT